MRLPSLRLTWPLAAALGIACADPGGTAQLAEGFVTVENDFFDPTNVAIGVGGTVTWTVGGGPHTVTFTAGAAPPDCGALTAQTCVRTFPNRGTFDYGCEFHAAMIGTVRVD